METNNIAALIAAAQKVQQYVLGVRRHLHENPETRWEESETLAFIKEEVLHMDTSRLTIKEMRGGLVVDYTIDPKATKARILFRADVDALNITEATGLPFASKAPGKMHACGHDTHAAMLLGAMKVIAEGKVVPTKNIRFVFQRAEENPITKSGGASLVEDGVCNGISEAHALHIWSNPETGKLGRFMSRPGGFLGNSGRIKFVIKASGGHVAMPTGKTNALRIANAVMNRLNTFIARNMSPTDPATLEPTSMLAGKGGDSSNVMPATAELWYGFRTVLSRGEHVKMTALLEKEVRQIVELEGGTLECEKHYGHPALINDRKSFEEVSKLLADAGQEIGVHVPQLGGEDFAHYLYEVPGTMWTLGSYTPGTGDHHTPTFAPDESVFWKGVLFWLLLATK